MFVDNLQAQRTQDDELICVADGLPPGRYRIALPQRAGEVVEIGGDMNEVILRVA